MADDNASPVACPSMFFRTRLTQRKKKSHRNNPQRRSHEMNQQERSPQKWIEDVMILEDSGASRNFVGAEFVSQHHLKTKRAQHPVTVTLADGRRRRITQVSYLRLDFGQGYEYETNAYVLPMGDSCSVILGTVWTSSLGKYITDRKENTLAFKTGDNQVAGVDGGKYTSE